MCTSQVEIIKKTLPEKIFCTKFIETPSGYCYILLPVLPENKSLFRGNIFKITRHVKWLNANKGYLGAYFKQKSRAEKFMAIMRIILVFGWLRKKNSAGTKIRPQLI